MSLKTQSGAEYFFENREHYVKYKIIKLYDLGCPFHAFILSLFNILS